MKGCFLFAPVPTDLLASAIYVVRGAARRRVKKACPATTMHHITRPLAYTIPLCFSDGTFGFLIGWLLGALANSGFVVAVGEGPSPGDAGGAATWASGLRLGRFSSSAALLASFCIFWNQRLDTQAGVTPHFGHHVAFPNVHAWLTASSIGSDTAVAGFAKPTFLARLGRPLLASDCKVGVVIVGHDACMRHGGRNGQVMEWGLQTHHPQILPVWELWVPS